MPTRRNTSLTLHVTQPEERQHSMASFTAELLEMVCLLTSLPSPGSRCVEDIKGRWTLPG